MFSVFFYYLGVSFADCSFCLPPPPWLATAPKVRNLAFCISPSGFTTMKHTPHVVLSYHLAHLPQKSTIMAWPPNCDPMSSYWLVISGYDISETELIFFPAQQMFPTPHIKPSLFYIWIKNTSLTLSLPPAVPLQSITDIAASTIITSIIFNTLHVH